MGVGTLLLARTRTAATLAQAFPRSDRAAYVTMGIATVWFLYHVLQLGPADFGAYRNYLFLGFGAIGVLSFFYVKDFLAVRGLAILMLLLAWTLLMPAYLQEPASRLFLVGFVYLMIVVALYLGVSPFRLRDFFKWLFSTERRPRVLGALLIAYGLLLDMVAFSYPG